MGRSEELQSIDCPVALAQNILAGKWKLVVVWRLKDGVMRFGELQRSIPGIKQSSLTQQLRELEQDGVIHREVYTQIPPKVEYSLTDIGRQLIDVLYSFGAWGAEYKKQCLKSGSETAGH